MSYRKIFSLPAVVPSRHTFIQKLLEKIQVLKGKYSDLYGLNELSLSQERVMTVQDELEQVQKVRRELSSEMHLLSQQKNALHEELFKVQRWEDPYRYLDLVKKESEILLLQKEKFRQMEMIECKEKDLFASFGFALRESYDKCLSQKEKSKFIGLMFSIICTVFGSLGFYYRSVGENESKKLAAINNTNIESLNKTINDGFKQTQYLISNNANIESLNKTINKTINDGFQQTQYLITNNANIEPAIIITFISTLAGFVAACISCCCR